MSKFDNDFDIPTFTYIPSAETLARIKATAALYKQHYPMKTDVEAMEDVVDGCIEEGWTLERVKISKGDR